MKRMIPERKQVVLQVIKDYQRDHPHMSPTIRELCGLSGISSTSVMNFYLDKLVEDGSIIRYHNVARGISVA